MGNGKIENYLLISVIGVGIIAILGLFVQLTGGLRTTFVSNSTNQGIIVNGEGLISVKPDITRVSLGVEAEAATAGEAQRKNSVQMSKIIMGLKNLGLAAKDIQTTEFSLFPERRFIKELNQEKVVGYRAVNQVTVTVRDMDKIGKAIDQSIKSGANNIHNVSFSVESPEKWRGKAIDKAVKDARSKAEAMAKASGVKIKKIVTMNESTIDVRPYQMNGFKTEGLQDAGGAVTPIESGNVKVTANVQVIFGVG